MKFLEGQPHHVQVTVQERTNQVTVVDWRGENGVRRTNKYANLDEGQDLTRENARTYDTLCGMNLVATLGFAMLALNEFLLSKSLTYNQEHPLALPAIILAGISMGAEVWAGRKSTDEYHLHTAIHEADILARDYHEVTFRN